MGTGFFNVYRQPWTNFVVIETIKNGKKKTVKATPLSNNNVVYDIEYKINIEDTNDSNMTRISIFLNKTHELLSQMITDASVFTYSYLSFIRSAIVRLNGSPVNANYNVIYPETDPKISNSVLKQIGEIITIDSKTTISYVLTNDIPFMSLEDFVQSLNNPIITNLIKNHGRNSIIVNINKNIYKPTQARSKVSIVPEFLKALESFIGFGIYYAILSLYEKGYYVNSDEIIPFTESESSYKQLSLSEYNASPLLVLQYPYLSYRNTKTNITRKDNCIKDLINNAIIFDTIYTDIDQSTLAGRIIYKWFSNKREIEHDPNGRKIRIPDAPFVKLQIFIDIYWRMFHQLIDEKILIAAKPSITSPKIYTSDLDPGTLGSYSNENHRILLNLSNYDQDTFNIEINKIKRIDISEITTLFNISSVFSKYFSPCKPATTLIHEIGHAFTNTSHSKSYHDVTNIRFKGGNNLGFEDMCTLIYQRCVERGLINEFLSRISSDVI